MSKLYYFPKATLLCVSHGEVVFDVINGNYSFELHGTEAVVSDKHRFEVGDYEEHTRESFDRCYPGFGY